MPKISLIKNIDHGRIIVTPDENQCLDTAQLNVMERSFRDWVDGSRRSDIRYSRLRVLIIFLLIRYAGAKLSEVLALNPFKDINLDQHAVFFKDAGATGASGAREVQIAETLSSELRSLLANPFYAEKEDLLNIDPGFVRRKFYERAQACGFSKRLGGPEMIRKARAVELMQGNMPLPAVQMMLGHSTPNLTSAYVSFSESEVQHVTRLFMERESVRKTSARNSFFGKIRNIRRGDIQTQIDLITVDGLDVTTIITNDSSDRLGLARGRLVTAEVKAPFIFLQASNLEPSCSAENKFKGVLTKVIKGKMTTECVVRISDATELCAIITTKEFDSKSWKPGNEVWAFFNCFTVVLSLD